MALAPFGAAPSRMLLLLLQAVCGGIGAAALSLQQQQQGQARGASGHGHAASMPFLPTKGVLSARSLRIAPSGAANGASRLFFGAQDKEISIGTDAGGQTFSVERPSKSASPLVALSFDADASKDSAHLASKVVTANSVALRSGLTIKKVHQWQLVRSEDFAQPPVGWNIQAVTSCGGVQMLGGYCKLAGGELKKTFSGLPPHRQIRVKAVFHFIDRWAGESGFLKLNTAQELTPTVVWTEMHSQDTESKSALSMCGKPDIAESKFSAVVDVTVAHTSDVLDMTFGSTLEAEAVDACEESWGVSSVEIYARD